MTTRLTDSRLRVRQSPLVVEHVNAIELEDELDHAETFVAIDLAHALMLVHQGVFDPASGRSVVAALLDLLGDRPQQVLDGGAEIGTITLQIERYLSERCGPAGLDIQRARSRIDQNATGLRMVDRDGALSVMKELITLAETLLSAAATYDDTLAPGYTHLQHAQPTTLGHYFNAQCWSVLRNLTRLLEVFDRLNECPLGGAAHSGTSWPIDRDLTASYLGFDRPVPNARDAGMSAIDAGAELASALALTLSGLSRCASDLYYWSSSEVALVRLDPSLCGTSSMMPQKRNPIALERIRALAGEAAGWPASQLGLLHFATSTDADQGYVHNRLPTHCHETAGAVDLLTAAVSTLDIDADQMSASAGHGWSTASALADDLVSTRALSYRQAHDVVARLISTHEAAEGTTHQSGHDPKVSELDGYSPARIADLLDPRRFIETRTSAGGTARGEREKLAKLASDTLSRLTSNMATRHRRVQAGRDQLIEHATALVHN